MKIHSISFALLGSFLSASVCFAGTVIGGATLPYTATVHSGTVSPSSYLNYVSGGSGWTGIAAGTGSSNEYAYSVSDAVSAADHKAAQFDPAILFHSQSALNSVIAVSGIEHGWNASNTNEFWEPFEFRIFGCTTSSLSACNEQGTITDIWELGVDDVTAYKNGDDWTSQWAFNQSYNYFAVFSGDVLVGGSYSPGEGEIDALAAGITSVPEPSTLALLGLGLGGIFFSRTRKSQNLSLRK